MSNEDHKIEPRVLVVGAGMSGILMGIKLQRAGFSQFTIYEKSNKVGGTWRDNTYPGLHCDVPSVSYCYSFAPAPYWKKRMSRGEDIRQYFQDVSDQYGITEKVEFNTELMSADYADGQWEVKKESNGKSETLIFDFVISACGVLHHPVLPKINGIDTFEGDSFHSSRWQHDVSLKGKRIAVVGTGSTAAQLIGPLANECSEVYNFQRTAQWIFPFPNREYSELDKKLFKYLPGYGKVLRGIYDEAFDHGGIAVTTDGWQRKVIQAACRLNLRFGVKDAYLRKQLTPDYEPLCKRMIMSDSYYASLQRRNVNLISDSIEGIESTGIRLTDGRLIDVDIIVYASGFDTQAYLRPIKMNGLNDMTLDKAWEGGPTAYRTIAMPDFPNFFMIQGPNAPVGNFSLISTAESQSSYIIQMLKAFADGQFKAIEPSVEATKQFNEDLVNAMGDTVWVSGCQSWYMSDSGIPLSWPWGPKEFRESMATPNWSEFVKHQDFSAPEETKKPKAKKKVKAKKVTIA